MKCVKFIGQGVPHRISDAEAFHLVVLDHDGEYCPKRVWREFYATCEDEKFVAAERASVRRTGEKLSRQTRGRKNADFA